MDNEFRYGLRVVGPTSGRRRVVDHGRAFAACCAADDQAEAHKESYLGHFTFDRSLVEHFEREGSERGFDGPCWTPWLFWDIDRPVFADAANDARRLAGAILERYRDLDEGSLLVFFSGSKGFHLGVPTALWGPSASPSFHLTARRFCEAHAARAGIAIDTAVYSKCRLFRAPNSRHAKTGRHKRRVSHDELVGLNADALLKLAESPEAFDAPEVATTSPAAAADWRESEIVVTTRAAERRAEHGDGNHRLTRRTMLFIREGAPEGERATALFRAAANLAELGTPEAVTRGLLAPAARESGMPPAEIDRQIQSGIEHALRQNEGGNVDAFAREIHDRGRSV